MAPTGRARVVGAYAQSWKARLKAGAFRLVSTLVIAAALAGIATWIDERALAASGPDGVAVQDDAPRRLLARYALARLRGALETYRMERGEYPVALSALVEVGLVSRRELSFPWRGEYYYRRDAEGHFVVLPPLE